MAPANGPAPEALVVPRVVDGRLGLFHRDGSRFTDKEITTEDLVALAADHPSPPPEAWLGVSYYVKLGEKKYPPKWAVREAFGLEGDLRLPLGGIVASSLRELGLEAGRRGIPFRPRPDKASRGEASGDAGSEGDE